jgi:uncharacterized integral membrane protein
MNHWPFIIAAYAIAIGGTLAITLASLLAMRRAEARSEAVTRRS